MFLTVEEIANSSVSNITSASPNDPQFLLYIHEAITRMASRGDWPGMVVPMRTCVINGCITWPRHVGAVRKMADCHGNFPIHGMFYDYLDWRNRQWYNDDYWIGLGWRGRRNMVQTGWSPVFADVRGPGRYLRLYNEYTEDNGATVTVFGKDQYGNRLRTRNTDGATYSEGMILTAQSPFYQSPIQVTHIERVIKRKTQGNLNLFGVVVNQPTLSNYAGYVYNVDDGSYVSITIVMSALGYPTLQFNLAYPPNIAQTIGYFYNYDMGTWQNVVAHGTNGNYYLEFGGAQSPFNVYGTQCWNPDLQQWQSIVLRGTIQNAQYLDINDPSAVAPSSIPASATTYNLEPIAQYEPSETNPKYVRQNFHGGRHCFNNGQPVVVGTQFNHHVQALVKLKQPPISQPNDMTILGGPEFIPALKIMVQAIIAGEANDIAEETALTGRCVEQLNRDLEDWMPDEQIPVDLGELGKPSMMGSQRCF